MSTELTSQEHPKVQFEPTHDQNLPSTRLATSPKQSSLIEALAKAQGSFGALSKKHTATIPTKSGSSYKYSYADLTDVLASIRRALADNGLAVVQPVTVLEDGNLALVTRLMHESGEWMESVYPLARYATPQEMGSAITYARRYALTSMLGIAAEDDDDAQMAQAAKPAKQSQPVSSGKESGARPRAERSLPAAPSPTDTTPPPAANPGEAAATEAQLRTLGILASKHSWTDEKRHQRAGVASFKDLTKAQASTLIDEWQKISEEAQASGQEEQR